MCNVHLKQRLRGAVAIGALATTCVVGSATWTPVDYTDTWWNRAEDGWGLQLVQQVDTMFATVYTYDAQSKPDWYVAALRVDASGAWRGDLYTAHGPWFGGSFESGVVTRRHVGDMTLTFSASHLGTLTYSVDGIPVEKAIERYPLGAADVSGSYLMWMNTQIGGCVAAAGAGPLAALASVQHTNGTMTSDIEFVAADATMTCTFTGAFVQTGRLAHSTGTYSCESGVTGTYSMTDLELANDHMCGDFSMRNNANGCVLKANFSGTRY
jgi:hypothetical protein